MQENINMGKYIAMAHEQADQFKKKFEKDSDSDELNKRMLKTQTMGYSTIPESEWLEPGKNITVSIHTPYHIKREKPKYPHNHDFFEFSYVYSGEFYNEVEQTEFIQPNNTITFLSPRALHKCYIKKETDVVFNIIVRNSLVESIFLRLLAEDNLFFRFFLEALYNVNEPAPFMTFECSEDITLIMQQIIKEYFNKKNFYENIIISRLIELFVEISRIYNDKYIKKAETGSKNFNNIMDYIETNYAEVTLETTAKHFNYSTSYLSKLIKKNYGENFSQIVHTLKLEKACKYLVNSDLPIEQIIELVGYDNTSHFYKVFKERFGVPPKQYRKINGKSKNLIRY